MTAVRRWVRRALWAAAASLVVVIGAAPARAATPEWNIARIGAPRSAPGVIIAVVDTGVDGTHPAFGNRVLPEIDVIADGRHGDPEGHGTHVAGTAAGADNGCGVIGVAPDARILPVRVLDQNGQGDTADVAEGIRRAADAGAAVINLSLGSDVVIRSVAGSGFEDAINYAWSKGSVPVLAAGNDGLLGGLFGSGYGDLPAVVVTATDNQDRLASYATPVGSARWGIAAPGGDASGEAGRDIFSAYPNQRCALSAGTSMAAPHVSGSLAVLRARGLGPQQAVDRLLATARDLGSESTYGAGLVDLAAAVGGTASTTTPPTTVPPTTTAPPTTTSGGTGSTVVTSSATPTTGVASTTSSTVGGPSSTVPLGPNDVGASDRATTTTVTSPDEQGAGVVVTDEGDGPPAALVVVAAAAVVAAGAAAGTAVLRARRRSMP